MHFPGQNSSYTPVPSSEELDALPSNLNKEDDIARSERGGLEDSIFDHEPKEGHRSGGGIGAKLLQVLHRKEWIRSVKIILLAILMPSYVLSRGKPETQRKMHPTAWLDGLRGVAALFVVFHHSSVLWFMHLNRGWGSSPNDYRLIQFPIIRLTFSGLPMVAIFFVVSGFSLSYKSIGLIRRGLFPELLECLSSSVMRRGLRLVLPPATVTFFSMLAAYFKWYGVGPGARLPPQSEFLWEHLKSWYFSVLGLADPFRPRVYPHGYNPIYDTNLWTIPVEFHGSMVIFTVVLGLSKVSRGYRLGILTGIVCYASHYAYSHLFLFLSGILLAELNYERRNLIAFIKSFQLLPFETSDEDGVLLLQDSTSDWQARWIRGFKCFWLVNFIISLFFLSMPVMDFGGGNSTGYRTLATWIPANYRAPFVQDTFWAFNGAVHLVFAVDNASVLQAIFTTRIAQYLGKISFALYICHGTFLYTLGYNLSNRIVAVTGKETTPQYSFGIFLTVCVVYPLLFWTADRVAFGVDMKSVSFARWMWKKIEVD